VPARWAERFDLQRGDAVAAEFGNGQQESGMRLNAFKDPVLQAGRLGTEAGV